MDEASPIKRRRTENLNDLSSDGKITKTWTGNAEISTVSVKPGMFQQLRRIATSCNYKEKIQNPKSDDIIISSVGSSPASSPRPENLTALSQPVDPVELRARLTVLVKEENKENQALKSGEPNLQAGTVVQAKAVKISEGRISEAEDFKNKNINIPIGVEEFYAVLRKMMNDKFIKLEEKYTETIIPDLEKKITSLEKENRHLTEHSNRLQEILGKVVAELQKRVQNEKKPTQSDVGIQVSSVEPPPLTPVATTVAQVVSLPGKPAQVVHVIDSVPGLYKPPSSTPPHATQMGTVGGTYSMRAVSIANGIRQSAAASTGHVFTSSAGQPRLYSEAPYKPGSHPNAVLVPRSHATFARPTGPITATVYPQPQTLQASPSTLSVHRSSPPTQSPSNRFPYNPQTPNGVMIRTQYVIAPERHEVPTVVSSPLTPRQKSPVVQGPPPSYSVATARAQQIHYHQGAANNPVQVNGTHHYVARQAPPSAAGPPPLVRAQSNLRPQVNVNTSPRYQPPQVIHQRPPYSQNTPGSQVTSVPSRHPNTPLPPSQTPPSQTNGIIRELPPPTPTVSISGAANGIVLSWNMTIPEACAQIDSYQLFAYQNNGQMANSPSLWKKLGIVKALPLPMACTLTQFVSGSMYYFAVRAIDVHGRAGSYSTPCAITLPNESDKARTVK